MARARLFDIRMHDATRHFGDMPESYSADYPEWDRIREAVPKLEGARKTGFTTDQVTEAWIDFELRGHAFSINNQNGEWWFFVKDPSCPDELLLRVLDHFEGALLPHVARARAEGPLAAGAFRAVVFEARGCVACRDFADRAEADRYADDAASETEHGVASAYVVDDDYRVVHVGAHY